MVFLGFICGVWTEAGHDSHQEFLLKLHVPTFSGVWIGKSARSASCTIRQTFPLWSSTSCHKNQRWLCDYSVSHNTKGVVSSRMVYPGRLAAAECQTVSQSVAERIFYVRELFSGGRCKGTRWLVPPPFLLGICRSVRKSGLDSLQTVTECLVLSHFLKHSSSCRWFLLIYLWN